MLLLPAAVALLFSMSIGPRFERVTIDGYTVEMDIPPGIGTPTPDVIRQAKTIALLDGRDEKRGGIIPVAECRFRNVSYTFYRGLPGNSYYGMSLKWLRADQDDDGSWNGSMRDTSMVLVAFLAMGENPASDEYGHTVEQAIRFILAQQRPDGSFSDDPATHARATYALAETYNCTGIYLLRAPVDAALSALIRQQRDYPSSVSAWNIRALRSGTMTEWKGDRQAVLSSALDDALSQSQGVDKLVNLLVLGKGTGPAAANLLLSVHPMTPEAASQVGIDYVFEVNQVHTMRGGTNWIEWEEVFLPMMIASQTVEARPTKDGGDWGYWDPEAKSDRKNGRAYQTALICISLGMDYRSLPAFDQSSTALTSPTTSGSIPLSTLADGS